MLAGQDAGMIPMRTSWIFRSRWLALLFASGVIWLAVSVAGPDESATGNNAVATDVTELSVNGDNLKQFADFSNRT
jgi:hypothetical protein